MSLPGTGTRDKTGTALDNQKTNEKTQKHYKNKKQRKQIFTRGKAGTAKWKKLGEPWTKQGQRT